jgi:hypothetical protein
MGEVGCAEGVQEGFKMAMKFQDQKATFGG